MPRALTNEEANSFLADIDVDGLGLPPWGGVVEWRNMPVLVFYGQGAKRWFLTDISDYSGTLANYPKTYDPWIKVFVYSVPDNFMDIAKQRAAQVIEAGTEAAKAVIPTFTTALIVIGLVALLLIMREAHV